MVTKIAAKIFGTSNERFLKKLKPSIAAIEAFEPKVQAYSDAEMKSRISDLREEIAKGASLDDCLVEVFALVREASVRTLGLRHYDVQLLGGIVLHQGKVAEMCTGEGKTLASTLAVVLRALTGLGVHVVTVNDYLAERDAQWMRPIYELLGLSSGVVVANMPAEERKKAYDCDITYGTNNEFGFDYLRDHMVFDLSEQVQRGHAFVLIDEVDAILIDEARTPLIISGEVSESVHYYQVMHDIAEKISQGQDKDDEKGDFWVDEKERQVYLTEKGHQVVEEWLAKSQLVQADSSLYDAANIHLLYYLQATLRAHFCYQLNVDYLLKEGKVMIVDEHTGRTMEGRRWSDGLHQAIEAKEGVEIQQENQTLASITFQNYFRMYETLSGMTGTADTEAFELRQIYDLDVVVIPTHLPLARKDLGDRFYITATEKFQAIVEEMKERHAKGQPLLVGTSSIESSEYLSSLLKKEGLPHKVLNAKHHEKEAEIIAQAGCLGAITIATNMAGRGTDIVLGGNISQAQEKASEEERQRIKEKWQQDHDQVLALGGLHVIGAERNESRRVDNQLRGRAGRQGDPGSSQYFLALDDNLMRIFASDKVSLLMRKLGMKEGERLEHPMLSRSIENAQKRVEGYHFDIRKQLLRFDDITNDQRKLVYQQRFEVLSMDDLSDVILQMIQRVVESLISMHIPEGGISDAWMIEELENLLSHEFGVNIPVQSWMGPSIDEQVISRRILEAMRHAYRQKRAAVGEEVMNQVERAILLQTLDHFWREHLSGLNQLRTGIHWRSYAQKDPMQEYEKEAFSLFESFLMRVKRGTVSKLMTVQITLEAADEVKEQAQHAMAPSHFTHESGTRISRNDPCPCGSGKKYKHCHGKIT